MRDFFYFVMKIDNSGEITRLNDGMYTYQNVIDATSGTGRVLGTVDERFLWLLKKWNSAPPLLCNPPRRFIYGPI